MTGRWPRWIPLALAAAGACAHVEPPPGGPEDSIAPRVTFMQPDSLAVVPGWTSPVILRFDERISEQGAAEAVAVSPRTSTVNVNRGREGFRVSLREGWAPGTIYHVTVNREVRDLFNNRLEEPVTLVFSTGPPIPDTRVLGTAVDRLTGRPSVATRVEAVRRADSLVYSTATDSAGIFHIAHIPAGAYLLRAYRDANRNRELDGYEPRDTAAVEVGAETGQGIRLALVDPDSTAPRLASASIATGGAVELRFDDYLDPAQALDSTLVQIADTADAGGAVVAVTAVTFTRPAPRDTAAPAVPAAPGAPAAPAPGAPAQPAGARAQPAEPLPSQTLFVQVSAETPLTPGRTYRVTARNMRNVVGLVGESTTNLVVPAPRPPPAAPPAAPPAP